MPSKLMGKLRVFQCIFIYSWGVFWLCVQVCVLVLPQTFFQSDNCAISLIFCLYTFSQSNLFFSPISCLSVRAYLSVSLPNRRHRYDPALHSWWPNNIICMLGESDPINRPHTQHTLGMFVCAWVSRGLKQALNCVASYTCPCFCIFLLRSCRF